MINSILNDYSQTIGAQVAQAEQLIPEKPEQFRAWTWKSKSPEAIYVDVVQGNVRMTAKFPMYIFAGKLAQVKETSDKLHYRLSDATVKAVSEARAARAAQGNQPKLQGK